MVRVLVVVALFSTACATAAPRPTGPSKADQRLEALEARVAVLEERLAAQDEQLRVLSQTEVPAVVPEVGPDDPSGPPARPGHNPAAIYAVDLTDAPQVGPVDAKLTLVEAYDFACPYCQRSQATVQALLAKYAPDVRLVVLHMPIFPQTSGGAALAACAAHLQGFYFEYADQLWTNGFPSRSQGGYDDAHLTTYATAVPGLNLKRWNADRASQTCKDWLAEQARRLNAVGVTGTPTFYINGHVLPGAAPQPQFETLMDAELKKANRLIAAGQATAATYYDTQVMNVGQQTP